MMTTHRSKTFVAKGRLLKFAAAIVARISGDRLPPFPAVAAFIVRDDQLLMVERSDGMGFCLPGGIMRWQESTQDTVQREVREETGYEVEVLELFNNYSGPERDPRFSSVCLAYTATVRGGQLTASSEGRPMWVPFDDVLALNLAFDAREMVTDYFTRRQTARST